MLVVSCASSLPALKSNGMDGTEDDLWEEPKHTEIEQVANLKKKLRMTTSQWQNSTDFSRIRMKKAVLIDIVIKLVRNFIVFFIYCCKKTFLLALYTFFDSTYTPGIENYWGFFLKKWRSTYFHEDSKTDGTGRELTHAQWRKNQTSFFEGNNFLVQVQ